MIKIDCKEVKGEHNTSMERSINGYRVEIDSLLLTSLKLLTKIQHFFPFNNSRRAQPSHYGRYQTNGDDKLTNACTTIASIKNEFSSSYYP
jgi:hypothetical protein